MDRSEYDDDQLLVRYLLGELPDDDAGELEQAVLTDGGLFEKLCAIEDDLVDAYVRGELAAQPARSFERRFLANAEGRSRVAMARGFVTAVDRRPAPEADRESLWQRLGRLLAPTPTPFPWRASGATHWAWATVLVLAVGLAWVGRDFLPSGPTERAPVVTDPVGVDTVLHDPVTLLLSQVRDAGAPPRVALAPEAGVVELQVELEGEESRRFRAHLESSAAGEVRTWSELTPEATDWGSALIFELPADLLPPGRYQVTVDAVSPYSNETVEYGRYTFEVVTP